MIEQRRCLRGVLPLSQLPRVQEVTATDTTGAFTVSLDFLTSDSGLPMIRGRVQGQVQLVCQRCLEPMLQDVDADVEVVLTASQTDRQPEAVGYELCIVEDERLHLPDFVEDEILLALPVSPRHESCEPARPLQEVSAAELAEIDGQGKSNPFAALKNLKDWNRTE
ncbi:MAG TPA: YceD family protein [Thiolinea sp.]|nr:YceD family protein [Thiolinea sp.]